MPGARQAVVRLARNAIGLTGVRKKYVLLDDLKRVEVPLMVVWGARDRILPVSHAYRAVRAAPHASIRVFDDCGHWPHMERAAEFNSLVLDFLSD
jgi:4,5:9,10-diseco-3-hydroxy-5,9,17-trioxoandrosta-1(10),2-diene-4-oate hydrolase